jgi:hypothetical protein
MLKSEHLWASFSLLGLSYSLQYRMTDPKIILAPQDSIDAFQEQVDALLLILEHPEALVTDESSFADFIMCYQENPFRIGTKAERQAELDRLLADAGVTTKVEIFGTIVDGIRKIMAENPDWPKRKIQ